MSAAICMKKCLYTNEGILFKYPKRLSSRQGRISSGKVYFPSTRNSCPFQESRSFFYPGVLRMAAKKLGGFAHPSIQYP